jgi:uncharacterized membrane protein
MSGFPGGQASRWEHAMVQTIGNPLSWSVDAARGAGRHLESVAGALGGEVHEEALPQIRRIGTEDLKAALRKGVEDFAACRTDVAFVVLLYPVIGIALAWIALNQNWLPLVFPMMSGFALIGPVAAVGLYEMSRRREAGQTARFSDAFEVARSPAFGAIFALGLMLFGFFLTWMIVADMIYRMTLGPEAPVSAGAFLSDTFTTGAGWAMLVVGIVIGGIFAAAVLSISVVSFPLLLDRHVGLPVAVITSMRVAAANPRIVALWGLIVAVSLAVASIPLFLGLIVVLPVLGHATWHLYRRAVVSPAATGNAIE